MLAYQLSVETLEPERAKENSQTQEELLCQNRFPHLLFAG